ncbi:MAG: hypothetical protein WAW69_10860, partial [Polaromonas sp.]
MFEHQITRQSAATENTFAAAVEAQCLGKLPCRSGAKKGSHQEPLAACLRDFRQLSIRELEMKPGTHRFGPKVFV